MLLKYNRDSELEVVGLGVFQPGQLVMVVDEKAKNSYLDTGYFDIVEEKKSKKKYRKSNKIFKKRIEENA